MVSDGQVDINKLNDFIKETKPPYMVPAVTMQIDKIPLNQNQKVNKKALPLPERKVEEIVKPENETQQKLFDCIAEVLGYTLDENSLLSIGERIIFLDFPLGFFSGSLHKAL